MYPLGSPAFELKRRTASDLIPGWVIGLLAGLQIVLWLLIIVLEAVSVSIDAFEGTIYAGFWCSGIFFTAWVSMFCFLCCGKANCCGVFLIVINTIAFCFSMTLIAFTAIFIKDPCKCYGLFCNDEPWPTCFGISAQRKVPYLKGLLACGVLMLLTNLAYMITYIAISIWLFKRGNADMDKMNAMFQNRLGHVDIAPQQQQQQQPPNPMNYPPQVGGQQHPPNPMNYPPQVGGQQHPPYAMNYPPQVGGQQHAAYPMNYPPQVGGQQYPPYAMNYPPQVGGQQYPPYAMNYPAQIGEQPYSIHLMNEAYRPPTPKKPTSQEQPSQNDAADDERL